MVDELQPGSHCPFLGLRDDPDTWYAFPAKANLCHKTQTAQSIPLGYQGDTCLTSNHTRCPLFTAEGKWRGRLPAEISAAPGDARTATQRWDSEWMSRVRDSITAEMEGEEVSSEADPQQEENLDPPLEETTVDAKRPSKMAESDEDDRPVPVVRRPIKSDPLKAVSTDDLDKFDDEPEPTRRSIAPLLVLIPAIVIVLVGIGVAVFSFTDLQLPFGGSPFPTNTPEAELVMETEAPSEAILTPTLTSIPPTPTKDSLVTPTTSDVEEESEVTSAPAGDGQPFDAILANDSNLRQGPGTAFEIIEYLTAGTHTLILGRDTPGLWVLVRLEDDREGWIVATQFIGDIGIDQIPIVPSAPTPPDS